MRAAKADGGPVGLVISDITNPFFAGLAQSLSRALRERGHDLLVADADGDPDLQVRLAKRLRGDGAIALVITIPHAPELLTQDAGPVLAIDRCRDVPYVTVDNVLGGRLATDHLFRQGYTRPGILYARSDYGSVTDRIEGYRQSVQRAGQAAESRLEVDCGELSYDAAIDGATELIKQGADAIFAINDVLASAAVSAAAQLDASVPTELGVAGYDDTPMASWPSLDLTSVAQDIESLGSTAATMALRMADRPGSRMDPTVLPPRLVVRGSTRRDS
jgi:LacI family transcriptional regulator